MADSRVSLQDIDGVPLDYLQRWLSDNGLDTYGDERRLRLRAADALASNAMLRQGDAELIVLKEVREILLMDDQTFIRTIGRNTYGIALDELTRAQWLYLEVSSNADGFLDSVIKNGQSTEILFQLQASYPNDRFKALLTCISDRSECDPRVESDIGVTVVMYDDSPLDRHYARVVADTVYFTEKIRDYYQLIHSIVTVSPVFGSISFDMPENLMYVPRYLRQFYEDQEMYGREINKIIAQAKNIDALLASKDIYLNNFEPEHTMVTEAGLIFITSVWYATSYRMLGRNDPIFHEWTFDNIDSLVSDLDKDVLTEEEIEPFEQPLNEDFSAEANVADTQESLSTFYPELSIEEEMSDEENQPY